MIDVLLMEPNVNDGFGTECLQSRVCFVQFEVVHHVDGLVQRIFEVDLNPEKGQNIIRKC